MEIKEKWFLASKRAPFQEIGKKFHIDQVTARLIRNRDVVGEEAISRYLYGGMESLYSPWEMKDMEAAAEILLGRISAGAFIRIIGDYDIDGICATYILNCGLKKLGAKADWRIPDRMRDGYGLNVQLVDEAYADGVDTILTCDNGISAAEQIAHAKALGMTVIVTDHHEVPYTRQDGEIQYLLPPADAVVNPKQNDCSYPFAGICGAVVAWKLVQALFERAHIGEAAFHLLLPFAAIATIGDVMDLRDENRIIVKEGLRMLHETTHPGLSALIEVNGLNRTELNAYHIGFVLGPCLNASGRLYTAGHALALFESKSRQEAITYAQDLKALNDERKELTAQAVVQALAQIEHTDLKHDRVLVVFLENCHESIAGIVAGRIREQYNKPVFIMTRGEHALKGSGRSIEAYSMFERLQECRDLLLQFGGHPMAAGLSLQEENLDALRQRLNEGCGLSETDFVKRVEIDIAMPISYLYEGLVSELALLEPFGKGNPRPLFAEKHLQVAAAELVGKNKNVLRLRVRNGAQTEMNAVCFHNAQALYEQVRNGGTMTAAYYPEINVFRGRSAMQLVITHYVMESKQ